jgi:hypothetical protein
MVHRSNRLSRSGALAFTLALVVGTGGCGNLTVGGFGEASVDVSGDAPDPAPSPAPASAPSPTPRMSVQGAPSSAPVVASLTEDEVEGHIEIQFSLALVDESGTIIQLGDDELQVNVDLRGDWDADAVDAQIIPAVRYVELRVVFDEIEIEVQGLVIDGQPIPDVDIDIDDPTLVVTRPLDLAVGDGEHVSLLVDLNSLEWLQLVNPLTGLVDGAVFASLIDVAVQEP